MYKLFFFRYLYLLFGYIFNLKRNRFEDLNKAILKSYNEFPDISRTNLSRTLTSAPIKDGKFDSDYIKGINDLDIDIMEKSDMVYDDSSEFKPLYAIQVHSLNPEHKQYLP